jgi:hypothetical protein
VGAAEDALHRRLFGQDRTGTVGIRNFDAGVVETLGAFIADDGNGLPKYYTKIDSGPEGDIACGPPGAPGVPVVFAYPEDVLQDYKEPFILVRRDDITAAMDRWQPAGIQYRAPGKGAVPFIATLPGGATVSGFDRMEQLGQAIPYDITYTIQVRARYRGATGQRNQVNAMFAHVLRIYPPYGKVNVVDSIGDLRGYEAFNEGISNTDSVGEVTERSLGFAITLRVEAELDLKDPATVQTVRRTLITRTRQI